MAKYVNIRLKKETNKKIDIKKARLENIVKNIGGKKVNIPKSKVIDLAISRPIFVGDGTARELIRASRRRRRKNEF